jgi:hypothetical protein
LLALLFVLSGCTLAPQAPATVKRSIPTQASVHRLSLPAHQQLRDLTADFAADRSGADTGIPVVEGERVVILAAGTVPQAGKTLGPAGDLTCHQPSLPEPTLPCYAVLYSIGLTGRAETVGTQHDFVATSDGNIFLGVNAPAAPTTTSAFQITILTIPTGTFAGVWTLPRDNFTEQGSTLTLAVKAFAQQNTISRVVFTATRSGQPSSQVCSAQVPGADGSTYACIWDMATGPSITGNGPITFGFTIMPARGKALANPDGVRAGVARYVFTQSNDIYAGYAAVSIRQSSPVQFEQVTGRWSVPEANCVAGEDSQVAIWSGMTGLSDTSKLAQLGSLSACEGGTPTYSVGWEMFPDPLVILPNRVQPGDTITASVSFHNGQFQLAMDDAQQGWHFSIDQVGVVADTAIAECIVEAPTITTTGPDVNKSTVAQLTNFGSVGVSCRTNKGPIGNGAQNVLYQMNTDDGTAKATTSQLDHDGSNFTVQWKQG